MHKLVQNTSHIATSVNMHIEFSNKIRLQTSYNILFGWAIDFPGQNWERPLLPAVGFLFPISALCIGYRVWGAIVVFYSGFGIIFFTTFFCMLIFIGRCWKVLV